MKKLFIYFSYTGNGDTVAAYMQENGCDVRAIKRKKPLPKSFFFMVMAGGFLAGINHKDKIEDFDFDVSDYDEVIIGSPVWNGKFASPVNTILDRIDLGGKKVSFVLYSGSGEGKGAIERIEKEYPESTYVVLKEPKTNTDEMREKLTINS